MKQRETEMGQNEENIKEEEKQECKRKMKLFLI
jgi:hypothetical protein